MEESFLGDIKRGNHMSELHNNASAHDLRPTDLIFRDRNRGAELAAQADLMLARYPADIRGQITELLQILAAKQGEAEIRVR